MHSTTIKIQNKLFVLLPFSKNDVHSRGIIIVIQAKREFLCTTRFSTSMFVMTVTSIQSLETWDMVQNSARTLRVIWLKNEQSTFLNCVI